MERRLRVGILGATGMVGQRFITLLADHPWFQVVLVAASKRSAGKTYEEAVAGRWKMPCEIPDAVRGRIVQSVEEVEQIAEQVDFVFSALHMPKQEIKQLEEAYAKAEVPVVSNNSAHRWTADVPMVIPELNVEHLALIETQQKRLGVKKGFIVVKPNCSIQSYTPALYALKQFVPTQVVATTYQAISGAGKTMQDWPEMQGNVIPFISGEEEKSEQEPLRIFGTIQNGVLVPAKQPVITTQCIRVPVVDGHTAAVFVRFQNKPSKQEMIDAWTQYQGIPQKKQLPSAPKQFITYFSEEDRPQVVLDRDIEAGMGISIGRLREDTIYDYKFIGLSHNTIRGAAGGAVLIAELLVSEGYL